MIRNLLLGALAGSLIGAACGALGPSATAGVLWWAIAMGIIGVVLALLGSWILGQSGDFPKMRAALPLSGIVLASTACVFTGQPFLVPVGLGLALGLALSRLVTSP